MNKLSPKAVIFDLGSTLIEYESVPWDELNVECAASAYRYLLSQGVELPDEDGFYRAFEATKDEYRRVAAVEHIEWTITRAAARLLERLQVSFDDALLEGFFDAYYEPVDRHLYVYDDTLSTLEAVRRRYPVLGLISNTIFPERAHRAELERFGIAPYLDFAVFSSTFGRRKPHPDIFRAAADQAGAPPADCVYIGDRWLEDVIGPLNAGMTPILKLLPQREYPDPLPADVRRITRLGELLEHLEI